MLTWKSYKYKMSEGLLLTFCIYTGKEPQNDYIVAATTSLISLMSFFAKFSAFVIESDSE